MIGFKLQIRDSTTTVSIRPVKKTEVNSTGHVYLIISPIPAYLACITLKQYWVHVESDFDESGFHRI